jgi:hypothetical protein
MNKPCRLRRWLTAFPILPLSPRINAHSSIGEASEGRGPRAASAEAFVSSMLSRGVWLSYGLLDQHAACWTVHPYTTDWRASGNTSR